MARKPLEVTNVNPEIIKFLREIEGRSIEETAKKLKISKEAYGGPHEFWYAIFSVGLVGKKSL